LRYSFEEIFDENESKIIFISHCLSAVEFFIGKSSDEQQIEDLFLFD